VRCRDVEKDKFIRSLSIIGPRALDRVSGITDILELGSFNDAATVDIEARDDSFAKHGANQDTCRTPTIKSEKLLSGE
jgi:hypothetical protein